MKKIFKKTIIFILTAEAKLCLLVHRPKIVAVAGSVGKTSAKEAIFLALKPFFRVRKSEKSFNSEIGLPLSILGLKNAWNDPFLWLWNIFDGFFEIFSLDYPEWLVLELGVDNPGDMGKTARLLRADAVVFSRFADVPVHVEFFDSPEAVIREKSKLLRSLKKSGTLILNGDDKSVLALKEKSQNRKIIFGFGDDADMRASNLNIFYEKGKPKGIIFRADYSGNSLPIRIEGALGNGHVYPILAALSVAVALNLKVLAAAESLSSYKAPLGRMNIINGVRDSIILDDTYNSSPVAAEEALKTLGLVETSGRKFAALGDMLELGKYSTGEHERIGKIVHAAADFLVAVGPQAGILADVAVKSGMKAENVFKRSASPEAGNLLEGLLQEGDVVLVKGSQSIRMEKAVEKIMARPEDRGGLLVRQEKEWLRK